MCGEVGRSLVFLVLVHAALSFHSAVSRTCRASFCCCIMLRIVKKSQDSKAAAAADKHSYVLDCLNANDDVELYCQHLSRTTTDTVAPPRQVYEQLIHQLLDASDSTGEDVPFICSILHRLHSLHAWTPLYATYGTQPVARVRRPQPKRGQKRKAAYDVNGELEVHSVPYLCPSRAHCKDTKSMGEFTPAPACILWYPVMTRLLPAGLKWGKVHTDVDMSY